MQGELKQLSAAFYRLLHSLGSDRSSSPICATCCSASLARSLHSLWVTLLSGPAHVVSVREERRCNDTSVRQLAAADFTAEGERESWREKEGETARAPRHARALSCQSWRGEWAYPLARSPDYLPSCPRSHAHIAHGDRAITSMSSLDAARFGLPGAPLPPFPLVEASLWKERRCSN